MHSARASHHRRIDILVDGNCSFPAAAERHHGAQQGEAFRSREVLLAQTEPPASAPENCLGELLEGPARLAPVRYDQQWRNR
jgi:hypothetical protein